LSCAYTGNFGDDIILEGTRRIVSSMLPGTGEINSFLRINKNNAEEVNQHGMLIIGGGELLSNSDVIEQIVSNDIKIPYFFLSVGIGCEYDIKPYLGKIKPLFWSVRSYDSLSLLHRMGIHNAFFLDDPIFNCPYEKAEQNDIIGVCFKRIHKSPEWIKDMAKGLDEVINKGIKINFISLSNQERQLIDYCGEKILISDCDDRTLAKELNALMKNKVDVLSYDSDPIKFLGVLASYKAIISERLHGVLAAYHAGVEFRGIPYHNKIMKLADTYGFREKLISNNPQDICGAIKNLNEAQGGPG
jgi:polysaccharide pyruvyl transferase WcaK-like protein